MSKILVIGSLNMDHIVHVPHMVKQGETILAKDDLRFVPGGKGANQAYAIGKLGGDVCMLGKVGKDEAGKSMIRNLSEVAVDTSKMELSDASTGTAWICVNEEGDNSIVVIPGANKQVDIPYIEKNLSEIQESEMLILQLEILIETVCFAAKEAKQRGKLVILDPAPAQVGLPTELFSYVDILKPNETELATLTGMDASAGVEDMVQELRKIYKGTLVISMGEKGVIIDDGDYSSRLPARKTMVVDTTAAGDSFVAGMALKLVENQSLEDAIAYAQNLASIVVSRSGAQSSIPTAEEVEELG
jgi:ribokinase